MLHFIRETLRRIVRRHAPETHDARVEKRLVSYCVIPVRTPPKSRRGPTDSSAPRPASGHDSEASLVLPEILSGAEERRTWPRYPCNVETMCQPEIGGGEMHWLGRAEDISRGGLELMAERRFECGTILTIQPTGGPTNVLPSLLARVVRVSGPVDNKWILGCRFLHDITDAELREFLDVPQTDEPGMAVSQA